MKLLKSFIVLGLALLLSYPVRSLYHVGYQLGTFVSMILIGVILLTFIVIWTSDYIHRDAVR